MLNGLNISLYSYQKKIFSETIFESDSKKYSDLIKPDLSPLLLKENQFLPKLNNTYKNKKHFETETPNKSPNIESFSSLKIKGIDLFGVKTDKNKRYFNESNFHELDNKVYIEKENDKDKNNPDINQFFRIENNIIDFNEKNICENNYDDVLENNFTIIKTLSKNKSDAVYKVKENASGKLFCIKKISEWSNKNNFHILPTILEDIQNYNRDWDFDKSFCMRYIKFWIQDNNFNLKKKDKIYLNKNLYILTEYYKKGDIINYLEQLEKNNFKFSPDFYWDLIFEMIIGLFYIHNKGYIHFDIKPTNYIVDKEGFLLLNDFGLSHKEEELSSLTDIKEGDFKYISKELLEFPKYKINNKTDIFSLGLTILEILAKIELPSNGQLWRNIRECGKVVINEKLFKNSNIKECKDFLDLIKKMISPLDERQNLIQLIKETNELRKRYDLLKKRAYKKSFSY